MRYRISGLTVSSDIALPGCETLEDGDAVAVIASAPQIEDLAEPDHAGTNWALCGETLVIAVPGIARFRLTGGRRIDYAKEPGADDRGVAAFLIGTMFGILLHQRGTAVFHGSAVEVGGRAVLFWGRSGAGKSTIAAAMNQFGHALLADDLCAVDTDAPNPLLLPDSRSLRLWHEAGEHLGLMAKRGDAVRPEIAKFHFEPEVGGPREARPIAAIYVLREAHFGSTPVLEPLNAAQAVNALGKLAYRPPLVALLNQQQLYLRCAARLVETAKVFALVRPMDFTQFDAVVDIVRGHWLEDGWIASVR